MKHTIMSCIMAIMTVAVVSGPAYATRFMENLDRGVVAVKVTSGVYIGWRMFATDPTSIGFNVYRGTTKLNSSPITTSTNYTDASGTISSTYSVAAVIGGIEQTKCPAVSVWAANYLSIPLSPPAGGTTPDGVAYTYSANDCSVGDVDGDGQYEIILKWDPSNSHDNSEAGFTGDVYLDAYKLDGTRLWRIDLGINIRAGAHYTQFMVYDLDGDGKAEVACKTAPGTRDGLGHNVIMGTDDPAADYRVYTSGNSYGFVLSGPEYLTVFNGQTGAELATTHYDPPRGNVSDWGDSYGNRVDRFLACVAYLDGVRPSLVMCRGYYTRSVLVAYNWRGGALTKVWTFDSNTSGNGGYADQGCHSLSVADVDGDGKDEIVYGSCTIDDNGKGLYTTGLRHGDALHVSDMDPDRPGLEVFQCHEETPGSSIRDARTGEIIMWLPASSDVGRACASPVVANKRGYQCWANGWTDCKGNNMTGSKPGSTNFVSWWDGTLTRQLLDGTTITKYGGSALLTASDCSSNNTTKSTPCLSGDILGDWREEVIFRTSDNTALRIYTTTTTTANRFYTLMQDPQYRMAIAWQNVAYNQPPHPSFYLGYGMATPPTPDIMYVGTDPGPLSPNPMTWVSAPAAAGTRSISMTATVATALNETEYYFTCTSGGGHNSGWQWNSTYIDTGLQPSTTYTYTATAREVGDPATETTASPPMSATTADALPRPDGPLVDDLVTVGLWHMEPMNGSGAAALTPDDTAVTGRPANDLHVGKGNAAAALTTGQSGFGQAMNFGTDGRQMAQATSSFPSSQEIRAECWIYIPSVSMLPLPITSGGTGAATMYVISVSDSSSANELLAMSIDTTGTLLTKFVFTDGSYLRPTIPLYNAGSGIDRTGKWLHVIAYSQYSEIPVPGEPDHNKVMLSVDDGINPAVVTLTGAKALSTNGSKTIFVGHMSGKTSTTPYRGFRGLMDELKISTVANYPGYVCQNRSVADITADCRVDFADVAVFANEYSSGVVSLADFNKDGHVDFADLLVLTDEWLVCGRVPDSMCP